MQSRPSALNSNQQKLLLQRETIEAGQYDPFNLLLLAANSSLLMKSSLQFGIKGKPSKKKLAYETAQYWADEEALERKNYYDIEKEAPSNIDQFVGNLIAAIANISLTVSYFNLPDNIPVLLILIDEFKGYVNSDYLSDEQRQQSYQQFLDSTLVNFDITYSLELLIVIANFKTSFNPSYTKDREDPHFVLNNILYFLKDLAFAERVRDRKDTSLAICNHILEIFKNSPDTPVIRSVVAGIYLLKGIFYYNDCKVNEAITLLNSGVNLIAESHETINVVTLQGLYKSLESSYIASYNFRGFIEVLRKGLDINYQLQGKIIARESDEYSNSFKDVLLSELDKAAVRYNTAKTNSGCVTLCIAEFEFLSKFYTLLPETRYQNKKITAQCIFLKFLLNTEHFKYAVDYAEKFWIATLKTDTSIYKCQLMLICIYLKSLHDYEHPEIENDLEVYGKQKTQLLELYPQLAAVLEESEKGLHKEILYLRLLLKFVKAQDLQKSRVYLQFFLNDFDKHNPADTSYLGTAEKLLMRQLAPDFIRDKKLLENYTNFLKEMLDAFKKRKIFYVLRSLITKELARWKMGNILGTVAEKAPVVESKKGKSKKEKLKQTPKKISESLDVVEDKEAQDLKLFEKNCELVKQMREQLTITINNVKSANQLLDDELQEHKRENKVKDKSIVALETNLLNLNYDAVTSFTTIEEHKKVYAEIFQKLFAIKEQVQAISILQDTQRAKLKNSLLHAESKKGNSQKEIIHARAKHFKEPINKKAKRANKVAPTTQTSTRQLLTTLSQECKVLSTPAEEKKLENISEEFKSAPQKIINKQNSSSQASELQVTQVVLKEMQENVSENLPSNSVTFIPTEITSRLENLFGEFVVQPEPSHNETKHSNEQRNKDYLLAQDAEVNTALTLQELETLDRLFSQGARLDLITSPENKQDSEDLKEELAFLAKLETEEDTDIEDLLKNINSIHSPNDHTDSAERKDTLPSILQIAKQQKVSTLSVNAHAFIPQISRNYSQEITYDQSSSSDSAKQRYRS